MTTTAIAIQARLHMNTAGYEHEDAPINRDSVHAPPRVLAERDEVADGYADLPVAARTALPPELHRSERRLAEIAVDVAAVQRAERLVADHVAAGDRAVAAGMVVDDPRLHRL